MLATEEEFDSKLSMKEKSSSSSGASDNNDNNGGSNINSNNNNNVQRSKSFAFRAPQENFSIQDFELGKMHGVGSYSKVCFYDFCFFFKKKNVFGLSFWSVDIVVG